MIMDGQQGTRDSGLQAFVSLVRMQGLGVNPEQIRHQVGAVPIGIPEMLRCAKQLGLKARERRVDFHRLATVPLPAIAARRDGGFLLLGKAGDDKVLVQEPFAPRPELMSKDAFEATRDGRLVLITRRAGLSDLSRRFDITWFLGASTNIEGC
jgi:subfamily B ATP-binding cassette protein HlyB/CyaB